VGRRYEYYVENIICKANLANMMTTQGNEFISHRFNVELTPASTGYWLEIRGSNPGGVERFSATVQTGPEAHPASYTMVTWSFQ
jgi:hypothetical protein